ncbi:MAG: hypothetical protein JRJ59_04600 [Deltaproteobacteria bacterium]|nr:hypothetical protein [Deltaproteobacteria bacterium]
MRPFRSVKQALQFYCHLGEKLTGARSIHLAPRVQDHNSAARTEDLLTVYLSIGLCLEGLDDLETRLVTQSLARSNQRLTPQEARAFHRAMTKLGQEMRRRGVVKVNR